MLKRFSFFVLAIVASSFFVQMAFADVAILTRTDVYFEMDGEPYHGMVEYTVDCYGYTHTPWADEEENLPEPGAVFEPYQVYSYSATCPDYGCEIYEGYYMNYREITHCTVTGTTEDGNNFFIEDFGPQPYTSCENADQGWDMYDGQYWRYRDEYWTCLDDTDSDYDQCGEYFELVPEDELITTDEGMAIERFCESTFEISSDGGPGVVSGETFDDVGGMTYEENFLLALLITLVVEVIFALLFLKVAFKEKAGIRKIAGVAALASIITLPYFWFVAPSFVDARYYLYIGEIGVIVVETLVYFSLLKLKLPKAFAISFLVNALSYGFGSRFLALF